MAGAVLAALRRKSMRVVQVQNPRMDIDRFDLIIANRHDELTGPNVFVTRTALHRVTPARLAAEAEALARPLRPVSPPAGRGAAGRQQRPLPPGPRLPARGWRPISRRWRERDKVGVVVTPSRRTDPAVTDLIRDGAGAHGGWVWDFTGDNPYFGMLALADLIVVTQDSVSMISEAVATDGAGDVRPAARLLAAAGPVPEAAAGRRPHPPVRGPVRHWPVSPLNDTPEAAAEMRRRLGL